MAPVTLCYRTYLCWNIHDIIRSIQQEVTQLINSKPPQTSLCSNCIPFILSYQRFSSYVLSISRVNHECFKGT